MQVQASIAEVSSPIGEFRFSGAWPPRADFVLTLWAKPLKNVKMPKLL